MSLAVYAVILIVYFFCPKYLQAIVAIANIFVPDMVPAIDEILMILMLLK